MAASKNLHFVLSAQILVLGFALHAVIGLGRTDIDAPAPQLRTVLFAALLVLAQTLLPRVGGGRIAAYETLVVTPSIANLIRENKTFRINSAIQTGAKFGMQLMDDALFKHWADGVCLLDDVLERAHRPDDLAKRIAEAEQAMRAAASGVGAEGMDSMMAGGNSAT